MIMVCEYYISIGALHMEEKKMEMKKDKPYKLNNAMASPLA